MIPSTHQSNGNMVQNGFPHHHSGQHGSSLTPCTSKLQMKSSKWCKKTLPWLPMEFSASLTSQGSTLLQNYSITAYVL